MHIKILVTSDIHAHIFPTRYRSRDDQAGLGLAKAATLIKRIQHKAKEDTIVLTIDNGDLIQGSSLAAYLKENYTEGIMPLFEVTNLLQYDAGVIGNHEFDYGRKFLNKALCACHYPILCANILDEKNHSYGKPYIVIEKKGMKIAVLGLTTQNIPYWEPEENIKGLHFVSALEMAQKYVPFLKHIADIVVIAYHGGYGEKRIKGSIQEQKSRTKENEGAALSKIKGVDALITGHQHRRIATSINGIPTIQPGHNGECVGEIDLETTHKIVKSGYSKLLAVAQEVPDTEVSRFLGAFEKKTQKWLDKPIAKLGDGFQMTDPNMARRKGHPFINLLNQVQLQATGAEISAVSLFNNEVTGFSTEVTIRDIKINYPFENKLVVLQVTGAQLRAALEQNATYWKLYNDHAIVNQCTFGPAIPYYNYDIYAGVDYTLDISYPVGRRVRSLSYHGRPVENKQVFRLAVSQYRALGGGSFKMYSPKQIIAEHSTTIPKLVIEYLRANEDLTPDKLKHNNYRILPE
ncbi:bifunctional metallophosphatase/5'-nucleotidase [Liquorilactobacillus oeni]|uniref:bifunctional metallophosphatase/5'-nucleotidase n=1 Tax=Liquorilactobacillus oeni TaxID=303241 RepID=UPI00070F2E94|nr:bifunctional UDP-sugar hydrolase/5'-nucleotidase [Liquorilactobacillus oeni]